MMRRFGFGINLDDPWRCAGLKEPKSIIIPHLISVQLSESEYLQRMEEVLLRRLGREPIAEGVEACRLLVETCKKADIRFVRCWFPWKYFEPEEGVENYPMDELVNQLASNGIELIPVVGCGYSRMLPEWISPHRDAGRYIEKLVLHAKRLVNRYKGRVKYWQIENEPNWWKMHVVGGWRSGGIWLESSFGFELIKALNDAVHEEDNSSLTIINLEADEEVKGLENYSKLCDIIGLDIYPNYKESFPVNTARLRYADSVKRVTGKPVIISETGYPSGPSWLGYTEKRQAEYVRRASLEAFECQSINALAIWRYCDTVWRSFPPQENYFGLFDTSLKEKAAFLVYSDTIKELEG